MSELLFNFSRYAFLVSRTAGQADIDAVATDGRFDAAEFGNIGVSGDFEPATALEAEIGGILQIMNKLERFQAHQLPRSAISFKLGAIRGASSPPRLWVLCFSSVALRLIKTRRRGW